MPPKKEHAHLDSKKLESALEKGDAGLLSSVLQEGHEKRVSSSNCMFQKDLVRKIMDILGYEAPADIKTTNKKVEELEAIKLILVGEGVTNEKVLNSIQDRIDQASSSTLISDGITKGFQSLMIESLAYRLRNDKMMKFPKIADAIDGAKQDIIQFGNKRNMTKKEHDEYQRRKQAGQLSKEEIEEEIEEEDLEE